MKVWAGAAALFLAMAASPGAGAQDPIGFREAADLVEVVITAQKRAGFTETSRGWALEQGGGCYVLTVRHGVVGDDDFRYTNIRITGSQPGGALSVERSASLIEAEFGADLAILSVAGDGTCPFALPDFARPPDDDLPRVGRLNESGRGTEFKEARRTFDTVSREVWVAQITEDDGLQTGWSGSSVFVGSRRIGLVFQVDGDDSKQARFYTQLEIKNELDGVLSIFEPADATVAEAAAAMIDPVPAASNMPAPGARFQECPECPALIVIRSGAVTLGESEDNPNSGQKRVLVGRVAIGETEVTVEQWRACARDLERGGCNGYIPGELEDVSGDFPIGFVSHTDATNYVRWLNERLFDGEPAYRLLSEAEFVYAARDGSRTDYPWGRVWDPMRAHGDRKDMPVEVKSYPPNTADLYDLIGNVREWVADCWFRDFSRTPDDGAPFSASRCQSYVIRGGDFSNRGMELRLDLRERNAVNNRDRLTGFRVARDLNYPILE